MKVGVIGAGIISEIYLQNMIHTFDNLEVVAIANRHLDKAQKRAQQFHINACTIEELLANPEIEMVVNLTPVEAHYEIIKRSLEAGKHVYTEKTITNDTAKAKELLALADAKGLYLGSAPDTFLGSALQAAKSAIEDGLCGEIHSFSISANRCNDLLISLFAFLRTPGTGILLDYGVYYLTALVSLLGPVERVIGITRAPYPTRKGQIPGSSEYGREIPSPNESVVSAVLELKNGIIGTLHIDAESDLFDQADFSIFGTKGILYLSDPNAFGNEVKFLPNSTDPKADHQPLVLWKFTPYEENARGVGPSEMADAIEKGVPCRASARMATHVLEVLEAILKSSDTGSFTHITSTCEAPSPLPQKKVPITNIGHLNFQMKNDDEMIRFYTQVLGMQDLFTLTSDDLVAAVEKQFGKEMASSLKERYPKGSAIPWIKYLKLQDHQFLELNYSMGGDYKVLENRSEYVGFQKMNYEVDDIESLFARVQAAGCVIKDALHETPDGSIEFSLLDPDKNEVQLTQYTEKTRIPLADSPKTDACSPLKCTTQAAFQVQDAVNMENFYCKGLGLEKVYTLTFGDLADFMEKSSCKDEKALAGLRMMRDQPFIDYLLVAPHQYIELFHAPEKTRKEEKDLSGFHGYQHICLEVSDIWEAKNALLYNGIKPDSEISLGPDGAYQFWLTDPDGNRIEMMAYSENAKQLLQK